MDWEAGTRTPIARSRVWSPTIGRPPNEATKNLRASPPIVKRRRAPVADSFDRRVLFYDRLGALVSAAHGRVDGRLVGGYCVEAFALRDDGVLAALEADCERGGRED
jgi:hypothetical protein